MTAQQKPRSFRKRGFADLAIFGVLRLVRAPVLPRPNTNGFNLGLHHNGARARDRDASGHAGRDQNGHGQMRLHLGGVTPCAALEVAWAWALRKALPRGRDEWSGLRKECAAGAQGRRTCPHLAAAPPVRPHRRRSLGARTPPPMGADRPRSGQVGASECDPTPTAVS